MPTILPEPPAAGDAPIEFVESTAFFTATTTALMYPICQEAVWSYGSAEAPSQLTFNLDPAGKVLRLYTGVDVNSPPQSAE